MDADRNGNAPRPEISAHVASCVIRLHAPSRRRRAANTAGIQYLLWATFQLPRAVIAARLHA